MSRINQGYAASAPNGAPHLQDRNWSFQLFLFAKNFVKHPGMIGWFLPSSRFVVDEVLSQINWPSARVIVEYGPGLGTFTREILRRMRPDATLIAFETNDEFYQYLSRSLRDPRFRLLHESCTEIESVLKQLNLSPVDYVISGIPFKTLPEKLRGEIVRKTHGALRPRGEFLVYQLSGAVRPYLERVFGPVRQDFAWLNIPPGRLFYCAR
jgi:phospholipid N-methyltransferase